MAAAPEPEKKDAADVANPALRCVMCTDEGTFKCVNCNVVYCSKTCQTANWREHKAGCTMLDFRHDTKRGRYVEATKDISGGTAILIEAPCAVVPSISAIVRKDIFARYFPAHVRGITLDETMAKLGWTDELVTRTFALAPASCKETTVLLRAIKANSFDMVCNGSTLSYGTAMYLHASAFNHACAPNAKTYIGPGGKIVVVAGPSGIKKGDEVTIEYTGLSVHPCACIRKTVTRIVFGFTCECAKCAASACDGTKHVLDTEMSMPVYEAIRAIKLADDVNKLAFAFASHIQVIVDSPLATSLLLIQMLLKASVHGGDDTPKKRIVSNLMNQVCEHVKDPGTLVRADTLKLMSLKMRGDAPSTDVVVPLCKSLIESMREEMPWCNNPLDYCPGIEIATGLTARFILSCTEEVSGPTVLK